MQVSRLPSDPVFVAIPPADVPTDTEVDVRSHGAPVLFHSLWYKLPYGIV